MQLTRIVGLALIACVGLGCQHPSSAASATHVAVGVQARAASLAPMRDALKLDEVAHGADNALDAVPKGHRMVDSTAGPLMGPDAHGTILITEALRSFPRDDSGYEPRSVVLVAVSAEGQTRVGRNDRIVPCATCGGIAGDPYADTVISNGRFTIVIAGGSRERWSAQYTFAYDPDAQRFVLERANRSVVDTLTDAHAQSDQDPQDFGVIAFDDFDPAQLGDAPTLP